MTAEGTSAQLGDEGAGELLGGSVGCGPVGEEAEAGRAGAADGNAEGAGGAEGVEARREVGPQGQGGRLEVVLDRGDELGRGGSRQSPQRGRVEVRTPTAEAVQLGV